jgi:UDP-3-O-[3-hydroxymyristoyl] glucosamine N-acyltransferase
MKFSEIVDQLQPLLSDHYLGSNPEITAIAAIDAATSTTISYIEGAKFAPMVHKTLAKALILPQDTALQAEATAKDIAWMATREPRLLFAQAISLFYQPFRPVTGIHPTAIIDASVQIGQDVHIGAYAVIEKGVILGDGACIFPHVVIYPQVTIGSNTILHANCTIHERTQIGENCVIHSGAVIGAEGFGFVPTAEGWYKMEQSGYVVLENGVEVGCNSTIDRPALGETRIGKNTKIDNLVHVGHGCQIGQNCALAGQVGLAGAVKLGNRVILGGQVGIANQAVIGDGVMAGAQSGITSDIEPGQVVLGSPALPHRLFLKASTIYKRLPEMYQTLKKLQKL